MGSSVTGTLDMHSGGIRERLPRLAELPGWPAALAAPQIPASAEALRSWLAALVDAAATRYLYHAPVDPAAQAELPEPPDGPRAAEETFALAVEHGDEHVIKFADTAADVYTRTGNRDALATIRAARLISR